MLAQGQASSAKRGGLAVVSSGLIFLKKKKKKALKNSYHGVSGRWGERNQMEGTRMEARLLWIYLNFCTFDFGTIYYIFIKQDYIKIKEKQPLKIQSEMKQAVLCIKLVA